MKNKSIFGKQEEQLKQVETQLKNEQETRLKQEEQFEELRLKQEEHLKKIETQLKLAAVDLCSPRSRSLSPTGAPATRAGRLPIFWPLLD